MPGHPFQEAKAGVHFLKCLVWKRRASCAFFKERSLGARRDRGQPVPLSGHDPHVRLQRLIQGKILCLVYIVS